MKREKYTFREKLRREWNAIDYALWRFRKNMTWGKALYLLSPVWVLVIIFAIWLIPTAKGDCGEMVQYRIVGTTMYVEGFGKMDNYYYSEHHNSLAAPYRPWRPFIRRVVIRDGVSAIGMSAFFKFRNLREVEIPDSVHAVQSYAFQNCGKLREIKAKNVDFVGFSAFEGCTALESVTLKSGDGTWTNLYDSAFDGCVSLERAKLAESVFFEAYCFRDCESLADLEFDIPLKVGKYAFAGCSSLKEFPLERLQPTTTESGETVLYIEDGAFLRCTSLEQINLPPLMTEIPRSLFFGCSALKEIELPQGITEIGENAFRGCSSLTALELPGRLKTVGKDAFSECTGLAELVFPECVERIDGTAFRGWKEGQTVYVYRDDLFAEGLADSSAVVIGRET